MQCLLHSAKTKRPKPAPPQPRPAARPPRTAFAAGTPPAPPPRLAPQTPPRRAPLASTRFLRAGDSPAPLAAQSPMPCPMSPELRWALAGARAQALSPSRMVVEETPPKRPPRPGMDLSLTPDPVAKLVVYESD